MTYATKQEIKLAEMLGFIHNKDTHSGSKFTKGCRHIWATHIGWVSADLLAGRCVDHASHSSLAGALTRPLTPLEAGASESLKTLLQKPGLEDILSLAEAGARTLADRDATASNRLIDALRGAGDHLKAALAPWQPIDTLSINDGVVLIFDPAWIHPDFNQEGIREGFRNEDDDGPIFSARWDDYRGCWGTAIDDGGTHWKPRPAGPGQSV